MADRPASGATPTVERLVFLHGFTQTHHHWRRCAHLIARRVAARHGRDPTLALVDLPGHGLAADDLDGDIDGCGPKLTALAGPGVYIGYSMGGRMGLVAAASASAAPIDRLVLIGATAGIDDPDERAARRASDTALADRIGRIGVDAFVDEWLTGPLFARLTPDSGGLAARRSNTAAGLTHSLYAYGTGSMTPLWSRLATIEIPVLVLAGEHDPKFTALGRRLAEALPDATFATVPGAGHAAHAEAPGTVADLVAAWL